MHSADFGRLTTFVAVAECGSFGGAAVKLGVSASAVSQSIRTLEERLGVRLINRTTRRVGLTDAGERLLERLRPTLAQLGDALEDMNSFRESPAGALRLSVSSLALSLIITPMMGPFLHAFPDITLELTVEDGDGDLDGRKDAGVRTFDRIPQDMIAVRASPASRMVAVAAPGYLARWGRPTAPADLAHHNCIRFRYPSGEIHPWVFEVDGRRAEAAVEGTLVTDTSDLVLKAAAEGMGMAYTVESHAAALIATGALTVVRGEMSTPFPGWFVYYPSRRQMPAALRAFIHALTRERDEAPGPRRPLRAGREPAPLNGG